MITSTDRGAKITLQRHTSDDREQKTVRAWVAATITSTDRGDKISGMPEKA